MGEMKALTASEAILAIEKKMNMSLDDLIKDSNKNSSTEKKKKTNTRRVSNKTQKPFHNPSSAKDNSSKLQRFTGSRSSHRQAAFALRRSYFQESRKFSVAIETGKRATIIPAPLYRQKPFSGKRIENLNTIKDRYPPVQRREAILYVAAKKWNDQGRMMVPTQRHVASQKWNNQANILVPKHKRVDATRKKSVWRRLSGVPSRNLF